VARPTTATRPVAVVTGASAGVGRATAELLAQRGFDVALLARGGAGLSDVERAVRACGARALAIHTDVAVWDEVDAAADTVERELGEILVWVNNAMTTVFAPLAETDPADFERATDVTYLGQVYGTMAALQRMRPRDRGRVVNVGSALAYVGIPLQAAYCGAKFASRGFTQSVHAELIADGSNVTVSTVHLPAVNTPQFSWCKTTMRKHPQPVPPIYSPHLAAERIVDTVFDGRRSRLLGSWNRLVIMGARLAPTVLAHYTARTAIDGQQTDEPIDPDRPSNLRSPVDDQTPWSAEGVFGDRSGGVLDRDFLRSMPSTSAAFGRSVVAAVRSKLAARGRRRDMEQWVAAGSSTPEVAHSVVETGVDPVTFRFSGGRSAN
jgi:NAD(P)-dependent dehydrogenase (short-subunit alcohol dehydrogenase family)